MIIHFYYKDARKAWTFSSFSTILLEKISFNSSSNERSSLKYRWITKKTQNSPHELVFSLWTLVSLNEQDPLLFICKVTYSFDVPKLSKSSYSVVSCWRSTNQCRPLPPSMLIYVQPLNGAMDFNYSPLMAVHWQVLTLWTASKREQRGRERRLDFGRVPQMPTHL